VTPPKAKASGPQEKNSGKWFSLVSLLFQVVWSTAGNTAFGFLGTVWHTCFSLGHHTMARHRCFSALSAEYWNWKSRTVNFICTARSRQLTPANESTVDRTANMALWVNKKLKIEFPVVMKHTLSHPVNGSRNRWLH
jgi:hypothetical protein